MQVRSIVGAELREQGRPPWADGPKVVGEAHSGFQGWSEGQSERTTGKTARAEEKGDQPCRQPQATAPAAVGDQLSTSRTRRTASAGERS